MAAKAMTGVVPTAVVEAATDVKAPAMRHPMKRQGQSLWISTTGNDCVSLFQLQADVPPVGHQAFPLLRATAMGVRIATSKGTLVTVAHFLSEHLEDMASIQVATPEFSQ